MERPDNKSKSGHTPTFLLEKIAQIENYSIIITILYIL